MQSPLPYRGRGCLAPKGGETGEDPCTNPADCPLTSTLSPMGERGLSYDAG